MGGDSDGLSEIKALSHGVVRGLQQLKSQL